MPTYPYRDPTTGRNYLLWKAAGQLRVRESALMSVELGYDGRPKPGAPWVQLLQTNRTYRWEDGTMENPAMIRYNGGHVPVLLGQTSPAVRDAQQDSSYATEYAVRPKGPVQLAQNAGGTLRRVS